MRTVPARLHVLLAREASTAEVDGGASSGRKAASCSLAASVRTGWAVSRSSMTSTRYVSKGLVRLTKDHAQPAVAADPLRRVSPAAVR